MANTSVEFTPLPEMEDERFRRNPFPQADPELPRNRLSVLVAVGLLLTYSVLGLFGVAFAVSW